MSPRNVHLLTNKYIFISWVSVNCDLWLYPLNCILHCECKIDFQYSFIDRLISKCAMQSLLNIPPYLKHIATLPCEISMFKNYHSQQLSEATCHARPSTQNNSWKKSCTPTVISALFNSLRKRYGSTGQASYMTGLFDRTLSCQSNSTKGSALPVGLCWTRWCTVLLKNKIVVKDTFNSI